MTRIWTFSLSLALLFAGGCGTSLVPRVETKKEEKEVKIVKVQEALFCFKCHSAAQYSGGGGKFPHAKHMKEFGLAFHCNQCHDVTGHQKMDVVKKANAPCSSCH
jgi:hypothetical protein